MKKILRIATPHVGRKQFLNVAYFHVWPNLIARRTAATSDNYNRIELFHSINVHNTLITIRAIRIYIHRLDCGIYKISYTTLSEPWALLSTETLAIQH